MGDPSGTIANIGKQFLTGYNPSRTVHIVQNKAKNTLKPAAGEKISRFLTKGLSHTPPGGGGGLQNLFF